MSKVTVSGTGLIANIFKKYLYKIIEVIVMYKSTNLVKLAIMIRTVSMVVSISSQAIAQETSVNVGRLKEILNAPRTAVEA